MASPTSNPAGKPTLEKEGFVKARDAMISFLAAQRERTPQAFLPVPSIHSPGPSRSATPIRIAASPLGDYRSEDVADVGDEPSSADDTGHQTQSHLQDYTHLQNDTHLQDDTAFQIDNRHGIIAVPEGQSFTKEDAFLSDTTDDGAPLDNTLSPSNKDDTCLPENADTGVSTEIKTSTKNDDGIPRSTDVQSETPTKDEKSLPDYSTPTGYRSHPSASPSPAHVKVHYPQQPDSSAFQHSTSFLPPTAEALATLTKNVNTEDAVDNEEGNARESMTFQSVEGSSTKTPDDADEQQRPRIAPRMAFSVGSPVDRASRISTPTGFVPAATLPDEEFFAAEPESSAHTRSFSDADERDAQSKKVEADGNVDKEVKTKGNLADIQAQYDNPFINVPFTGLWNESDLPERFLGNHAPDTNAGGWIMNAAEHSVLNALESNADNPQLNHCDIDTATGELLPEVEYPESLYNGQHGPARDHRDIGWRHAHMTAELQILKELKSRERLAELYRDRSQEMKKRESPNSENREGPPWPKADCVIRPARVGDFKAIADIINAESLAETCPQIFHAIRLGDLEGVFARCKKNLRPFIVAIYSPEEELLDRKKWPKGSEKVYQEFLNFCASRSRSTVPKVVGFAFVDEVRYGFTSLQCVGSRHTGQIRVAVHPSHRQTRYGTALLDRLLVSVAPYHQSLIDYTWKCAEPALTYESPAFLNKRQYAWMFAEMICPGKESEEFKWRAKMLEKFGFQEVAFLDKYVRTDRHYQSEWLDMSLWRLLIQPASRVPKEPPVEMRNDC